MEQEYGGREKIKNMEDAEKSRGTENKPHCDDELANGEESI